MITHYEFRTDRYKLKKKEAAKTCIIAIRFKIQEPLKFKSNERKWQQIAPIKDQIAKAR